MLLYNENLPKEFITIWSYYSVETVIPENHAYLSDYKYVPKKTFAIQLMGSCCVTAHFVEKWKIYSQRKFSSNQFFSNFFGNRYFHEIFV